MSRPAQRIDSARSIWLTIHLWLALGVGLLYVLIGLSGSLLVCGDDLDTLLNPRLRVEEAGRPPLPLDRILAAVKAAHPDRFAPWTLELPRAPDGMITAWFERPRETRGEFHAPLMVSVHPVTGEMVASRFWGKTAVTWLFRLHAELHMGEFGWKLTGLLGLALTATVLSGLYLWWPGLTGLRRAFTVRHDAGLRRFAVDLHRLIGVGGSLFLLMFALSGFHLVYPGLLEAVLGADSMGHGEEIKTVRSSAAQNDHPVSLAEAVLVARGLFPHGEVRRVTEPDGAAGTYRIELRQRDETYSRHPATWIWVDRWSGQIREVQNPRQFSAGARWLSRIWPVHTGEAVNSFERVFWFLAGLLPLALYVSGLAHWLIARGTLGDRRLDFRPLQRAVRRLRETIERTSVSGYRRAQPLVRDAYLSGLERFAQWMRRR